MAYDEGLAQRIQDLLVDQDGLEGKKMFGGIGFLVYGNMACGVNKDALIVRVGPDAYQAALAKPHTRQFDMAGRPMRGWVMVDPEGHSEQESLEAWVHQGLDFALTLPPK
jgi:TfoX/Sxy family transcriptional regulator of competence genes